MRRAQELSESRGGRPRLQSLISLRPCADDTAFRARIMPSFSQIQRACYKFTERALPCADDTAFRAHIMPSFSQIYKFTERVLSCAKLRTTPLLVHTSCHRSRGFYQRAINSLNVICHVLNSGRHLFPCTQFMLPDTDVQTAHPYLSGCIHALRLTALTSLIFQSA